MGRRLLLPLAAVALAALGGGSVATGADEGASAAAVRLIKVGTFSDPLYVTAARSDKTRVFVVEKEGQIRVLRKGKKLSEPFVDLRKRVVSGGFEQGLLSLAFAPDYSKSRRFYVYYTGKRGDGFLDELKVSKGSADRADTSSRRTVLRIPHSNFENHNGGQLQFGPDKLLYLSTGDGGGAGDPGNNAQDLGSRLGKILRISPKRKGKRRYTVPKSNPYRGSGRKREIYAYGLRNPWRFSFDRSTGDLAIADVGQDAVEEINFVRRGNGRGANFGWSRFEGTRRFKSGRARGHVEPVIQHSHGAGWCSITGGFVVRDKALDDLLGRYVYGDYCRGEIWSARLRSGGAKGRKRTGLEVSTLSSFGEDARGRVYVTSLRGGGVYRLAPR